MATVGIIANPAAGKDIRRLVAHGRFVPNHEKVNTLRRIMSGLDAVGVEQVVVMPDSALLGRTAMDGAQFNFDAQVLDMPIFNNERDSFRAAELMAHMSVGCLVVLGGDGTNRAVAKSSKDVPLVSVSTGTNNVFPEMVEGTVGGLAAGVVAKGLVDIRKITTQNKLLEVYQDGVLRDIALIDIAVSREPFVGARAIWQMDLVHEIFLTRAEPDSIGLSAIGAQLHPIGTGEDGGVYIRLGEGGTAVRAAVAPGVVIPVAIEKWRPLKIGECVDIELSRCTVALDGERTFSLPPGESASVVLSSQGPRVVHVSAALREAAMNGVFVEGPASAPRGVTQE